MSNGSAFGVHQVDKQDLIAPVAEPDRYFEGLGFIENIEEACHHLMDGDLSACKYELTSVVTGVADLCLDPIGYVISAGVSWLLEYMEPLKSLLNLVTGDHAAIEAGAESWRNIAATLKQSAEDCTYSANEYILWQRSAAIDTYYKRQMTIREGMVGAAKLSTAMGAALYIAGAVVDLLHDFIRDLLAELSSQVISNAIWIAATAGTATPVAVMRVANASVRLARRAEKYLTKAAEAFMKFKDTLDWVTDMLESLLEAIQKGSAPAGKTGALVSFDRSQRPEGVKTLRDRFNEEFGKDKKPSPSVDDQNLFPPPAPGPTGGGGGGFSGGGGGGYTPPAPAPYTPPVPPAPAPYTPPAPPEPYVPPTQSEIDTPPVVPQPPSGLHTVGELSEGSFLKITPEERYELSYIYSARPPHDVVDVFRALDPAHPGMTGEQAYHARSQEVSAEKLAFTRDVLFRGDVSKAFGTEGTFDAQRDDIYNADGTVKWPDHGMYDGAVPGSVQEFGAPTGTPYATHMDTPVDRIDDVLREQLGIPEGQPLQIDRLGDDYGTGFNTVGADGPESFDRRALMPQSLYGTYRRWELNTDALPAGWSIRVGTAQAAFGYGGGATQIIFLNEDGVPQTMASLRMQPGLLNIVQRID